MRSVSERNIHNVVEIISKQKEKIGVLMGNRSSRLTKTKDYIGNPLGPDCRCDLYAIQSESETDSDYTNSDDMIKSWISSG